MKKLLLGALSALVFLLGFASCDGGMHDLKLQPVGILGIATEGSGYGDNYAILMNAENGDEQYLTFIWSSETQLTAVNGRSYGIQHEGTWSGGSSSELDFGIVLPSGIDYTGENKVSDWTQVRRGDADAIYLTMGGEYTSLTTSSLPYPGNVIISGLVDGEAYTIYANYDSSAETVKVRVEGKSSDPTQFRIVAKDENSKNFPAKVEVKDADGKVVTDADGNIKYDYPIYGMSASGSKYTYQFIAIEDETIVFSIENDLLGTMAKNTELSVKKDFEYKITFTKEPGQEGKCESENIPFLKNAQILSNREHSYDFYEELNFATDEHKLVVFKSTGNPFEFYLNRDSSGLLFWDKGEITSVDTPITLRYVDNQNATSETEVSPVKVSAFDTDEYYALNFETSDSSSAIVAKISKNTLLQGIDKVFIGGGIDVFEEIDDSYTTKECMIPLAELKKVNSGDYFIEFTYSGSDGWGGGSGEHKLTMFGGSDFPTKWDEQTRFGGGSVDVGAVGLTYKGDANITLSGLTAGTKYKLTVSSIGELFTLLTLEEVVE